MHTPVHSTGLTFFSTNGQNEMILRKWYLNISVRNNNLSLVRHSLLVTFIARVYCNWVAHVSYKKAQSYPLLYTYSMSSKNECANMAYASRTQNDGFPNSNHSFTMRAIYLQLREPEWINFSLILDHLGFSYQFCKTSKASKSGSTCLKQNGRECHLGVWQIHFPKIIYPRLKLKTLICWF